MKASPAVDHTAHLESLLGLVKDGDESAREQLIAAAQQRLRALAHDMLHGDRLHRWEQTDDVLQETLIVLHRHLAEAQPANVREFFALASFHMRRALISMARHYYGPLGMGTHHTSGLRGSDAAAGPPVDAPAQTSSPSQVVARAEQWVRLQHALEELPEPEREVTEMLWFHGLSRVETARILNLAERTVRRRWQRARLMLHQAVRENGSVFVQA